MQLEAMGLNVMIYSSSIPMGDEIGIYKGVGTGLGVHSGIWQGKPFFVAVCLLGGVKEGLRDSWKTLLRTLNYSCLSEDLPSLPCNLSKELQRKRSCLRISVPSCKQPM